MFSWESIKKNQPVNITGAILHSLMWVSSGSMDVTHPHSYANAEKDQGIVVYFLHGTADRISSGYLLSNRLLNELPNQIVGIIRASFEERWKGHNIPFFAEQLKNKILANKHKNVVVIGHSRGGLVGAYFAEYLAEEAGINVCAVISICSPFGGSDLALWPLSLLSESVSQMARNSDFLKSLTARMAVSSKSYLYFAAENDALVDIESACIPEHRDRLIILDRHGHLSILSSHRLVKHIQTHLTSVCVALYGNKVKAMEENEVKKQAEILDLLSKEIETEITAIKVRFHIWSPDTKIQVLEDLKTALIKLLTTEQTIKYENVKTLGDYIACYLQDPAIYNGKKPLEILNASLNSPFSLLSSTKVSSCIFIEKLISKYQSVPLTDLNENKGLLLLYNRK